MIQRRQFLGSMAAFCATTTALPRFLPAAGVSDLKWHCDVIEPQSHHQDQRNPVVTGVSLQPNGQLMAIVGDDHQVCLYHIGERRFLQHLDRHSDWIRAARFSPQGNQLATGGNDRSLLIWKVKDWYAPAIEKKHPEAIIEVAFSNSGQQLATVGFEQWLRIYDSQSGDLIHRLECPCPDNHAVAFSNNDNWIAAGGRCGNIRVWETATGRQIAQFKAHRQRIRSIDFSNEMILSAGDDQRVVITNPINSSDVKVFPRQASKLYATALLTDGLLATAGSDNLIHVWQLSDLQEVGLLKGHTGTVSCLDFSGNKLVSGSYDTHVRLWSTEQHTSAPEQRHTDLGEGWNRKLK